MAKKKDKGNKRQDHALSGEMLKKDENLMAQLDDDESNVTQELEENISSIQLKNGNGKVQEVKDPNFTLSEQSQTKQTPLEQLGEKRTKLLNKIQEYSIREKADKSNIIDPDQDARLKYQLAYEKDSIKRIAASRKSELENKLLLAAEIVHSIEILLNNKFARKASEKLKARQDLQGAKKAVITFKESDEPVLKQIDELKKANNKKVVFKDAEALKSFLEKNKPNIDKNSKETVSAIMLYDALDKLNQNDIDATLTQLQNFEKYVNDEQNTDIKKLFDEKKQDISKFSQPVKAIVYRSTQIIEEEQKMQQNRKVFLESLDKEYEQVNTEFQTLRKSLGQNIQSENEVAALEAKRIISEQKGQSVEAQKDNEVKTKKSVAKRAGQSLKNFAKNTKDKAHELGTKIKTKVSQAWDKVADTEVVRGLSSLNDAIVKDDMGKPRNWKEIIKRKFSRGGRSRGN